MSRITITSATVCSESSGSDSVYSAYHLSLTDNPGRDEIGLKDLAIENQKRRNDRMSNLRRLRPPSLGILKRNTRWQINILIQ